NIISTFARLVYLFLAVEIREKTSDNYFKCLGEVFRIITGLETLIHFVDMFLTDFFSYEFLSSKLSSFCFGSPTASYREFLKRVYKALDECHIHRIRKTNLVVKMDPDPFNLQPTTGLFVIAVAWVLTFLFKQIMHATCLIMYATLLGAEVDDNANLFAKHVAACTGTVIAIM
ncbi:hypothetical protein ACJX0J_022143, partial [Zea mays]